MGCRIRTAQGYFEGCYSPDGKTLVSGGDDRTIRILGARAQESTRDRFDKNMVQLVGDKLPKEVHNTIMSYLTSKEIHATLDFFLILEPIS